MVQGSFALLPSSHTKGLFVFFQFIPIPRAISAAPNKITASPITSRVSRRRVRLNSLSDISGALFSFKILFQRTYRIVGSRITIQRSGMHPSSTKRTGCSYKTPVPFQKRTPAAGQQPAAILQRSHTSGPPAGGGALLRLSFLCDRQ